MQRFFLRIGLAIVLCSLFSIVSYAQSNWKGYVKSGIDSAGLSAKIVTLRQHHIVDSTWSQKDGFFSISLSNEIDIIRVSSMGFKDTLFNIIDFSNVKEIYLKEETVLLQDVTIVARSNVNPTIKSDKITYSLKKNIAATGSNVWNLLGQIPNVQLNGNQIGMVGKGSVKVSIDGKMVQLSDKDLANYLQTVSSNSIEKLEIVQNPSADMDALGNNGIINIITKRQKNDGYQLNIQSAYKQFQRYPGIDFSENLTYKYKDWDFFINTNVSRTRSRFGFGYDVDLPKVDWILTDTGNYQIGNVSTNFGADYRIGKKSTIGTSIVLGRYFEKGADYVRNPYFQQMGSMDSLLKTYATYYPIAYTQSYNLHYEWKPDSTGKKLFLDGTYFNYHRTDKSDYEGYMLWNDNDPIKKDIHLQANKAMQNIHIYTFRADYSLPTSFATWKFGTKLNFINTYVNALYYDKIGSNLVFNRDVSSEYKYGENTEAFYAEGNKKWDRLSLGIGLRGELTQTKGESLLTGDKMHNNYLQIYPVVNLDYTIDNDHTYSFTFGRRINRPTFWNLNPYKSMLTAYSYYEGNPYLQPEYNTNITFQYNYKSRWISAVYFSLLDNGFGDITIADTMQNLILRTPKNFVKSNKYGFSETFTYSDIPWLNTNNSIAIYYTDSKSKLDYVEGRKGWGAYFSTNNTINFNKSKSLSGLVNFWYQMPETNLINRSNHYYSLDIGMNWSVIANKFSLTANLHDLFNSSAPAYTSTVRGITETYWTLQLNRFFTITATFNLGNNKVTQKEKSEDAEESKNRL